jgi:uncharacterized protein involved in exopolysaccharide biosynthesis
MDARPEVNDNDEISLFDIYDFLRDGWKTLIGFSVLGLIIGVAVSFALPEKFRASGQIEPARVAGENVEEVSQLAEKLRSPTYYSTESLAACQALEKANPADFVAKGLNPSVGRQSAFVSVAFEADSPDAATVCLSAVIKDVINNQEALARASQAKVTEQIRLLRQQYDRAVQLRDQQLALNMQRLAVAKEKLASAQFFIKEFENKALTFNFKDDQFSASSLLVATLQSKQNAAKDLQIQIDDLEMQVKAKFTSVDGDVFKLQEEITELQASLEAPATRNAQFATPIYAPDVKVSPKRALITVIAILVGGFAGLILLIGRRAYRSIAEREAYRKAAQA